MKDLRPSSLCNVVYKLVSKVLANRLKCILGDIILENQSAFVPGRLISDNTILAYEMTHYMKRKRSGTAYAALKLDMSKAYDRVEWNFLREVLVKLGFCDGFVANIMKCVTTVKYRFCVNGALTVQLVPRRGIRQGDPISAMLVHAETAGSITGIKLCMAAPAVNHLLFEDDSMLLLETREDSAHAINNILHIYEQGSGQVINRDKSSIMFSTNCSRRTRSSIMHILGLRAELTEGKYLGPPTYIGRSKTECFSYLKERVWKHIQGWKEKVLLEPERRL